MVRFGSRDLAVKIRDDGVGIPREVLEKGHKPDHFGLVGMRERAERIGGRFSVDSRRGMGCAVSIAVPARLAFGGSVPKRWWLTFWRSTTRRQTDHV